MARSYKRDKNGRFSGGGGGGQAKAPSVRGANNATDKRLNDKGLRAVGGRLAKKNASLYQGTERTKAKRSSRFRDAGEQLTSNGMRGQPAMDGAWNRGAVRSGGKMKGTMSRKRK